ncbi:MAG: hypothetical protein AAFR51_15865 [Pseudomonadota bacterium]
MFLRLFYISIFSALAACAVEPTAAPVRDAGASVSVTTEAANIIQASEAMANMCDRPNEFGDCACQINGTSAPCDLAIQCLAEGDCRLARQASEIINLKTAASSYQAISQGMLSYCANPAEYWRCQCSIDGVKASCSAAQRCLNSGFCVKENEVAQ